MPSNYPPISVVVPLYNGAKYIEAALSSVWDQPVPISEIIVIDDGSTDTGAALARRHPSQPIVVEQTNLGPSATRNRGIKMAQHPFVAFMDQDDLWHPDKLRLQCAAFAKDPDLLACFGKVDYFWDDPDCEEARLFKGNPRTTAVEGYITTTMLTRASVFETVGLFDEALSFADSIKWCAHAKDIGTNMQMLDDVVLYHRMHDNNLTRRRKESTAEIMQLLRQRRNTAVAAGD